MITYTVTQEGARFHVRLSSANGQVVATLSSQRDAELFAEDQIAKGESQKRPPTPDDASIW